MQRKVNIQCKKALMPPLLICQLFSIYKIRKKILIYKKYTCNLGQSNSNLLEDYTYAKIVIISTKSINLPGR